MTTNKRHIHYINPDIQNRLIISFVIFELLLISITVFILYTDMSQIIEDNMFRSHIKEPLNIEFFSIRLLQAVAILLVINLIAASFIVWRWRSYINNITRPLETIIDSINQLDFSIDAETEKNHETLVLAESWLNTEKERFTKIRQLIAEMDINNPSHMIEKLNISQQFIKEK
ncbi:MAG: hypothetical protein OEY43_00295 [Gammaproteobacteria bacterium]|nr:hypothetical protein [Gammaproteobacteria bacterium]